MIYKVDRILQTGFASVVKTLLKEQGLSMNQASLQMGGGNKNRLQALINSNNPTLKNLCRVADVLQINASELILRIQATQK